MPRATRPTEEIRAQLRKRVTEDSRGYDEIAELVGIKGPTLHRFLKTPGMGTVALPKLLKMFGFDPVESLDLDDDQRAILRLFDVARDKGRDGRKLVDAFRTMVGIEAEDEEFQPPKTRGQH